MAFRVAETPPAPVIAKPSFRQRIFPISTSSGEIPAMDGLRAIALGLVFLYHAWGANPKGVVLPGNISPRFMSTFGQMGVLLFFVLSGFLLFQPYARAIISGTGLPATRTFYLRRALRILPAYWSAVILIAIIVDPTLWQPDRIWHIISHLTFLYTFHWDTLHSLNGVFWSLGIEMQFYIILPLLARLTVRIGRQVGGSSRAFALIFGLMLVLSLGWHYYFGNIAVLPGKPDYRFFYEQLPSLLIVFGVGMGCAWLHALSRHHNLNPARLVLPATLLGAVGLLLTVYATGIFGIPTFIDPAAKMGVQYRVGLDWDTIVALALGAVLLGVLFGVGGLRWLLSLWPLRVIALVSYSFYIWHNILITRIVPEIDARFNGIAYFGMLLAVCGLASLVVGLIYFHIFERPYLRRKKRMGTQTAATTPAP